MEINHTRFVIAHLHCSASHFNVVQTVPEAVFDPIGYSLRDERHYDQLIEHRLRLP